MSGITIAFQSVSLAEINGSNIFVAEKLKVINDSGYLPFVSSSSFTRKIGGFLSFVDIDRPANQFYALSPLHVLA